MKIGNALLDNTEIYCRASSMCQPGGVNSLRGRHKRQLVRLLLEWGVVCLLCAGSDHLLNTIMQPYSGSNRNAKHIIDEVPFAFF